MEKLTLESLPKAFTQLAIDVNEIKRLLLEKSADVANSQDQWFDLAEFCSYHPDKPTKPTVYGWVNAGTIPVHKGGKKLRFLKSEIDQWLKLGKKKTLSETASEAEAYCSTKRKRG